MKKNYSTFKGLGLAALTLMLVLVSAINTQLAAQCKGAINVSLNQVTVGAAPAYTVTSGCSYTVTNADVLSSPGALGAAVLAAPAEISRNGGGSWTTGATSGDVTKADLGRTLMVRPSAATGINCWGYVTVEDKTGPLVFAPADVTLACSDDNRMMLAPVATAGTSTGEPTVRDCSDPTTYTYFDVMVANGVNCALTAGPYAYNYTNPITGVVTAGTPVAVSAATPFDVMVVARFFIGQDAMGNKTFNSTPQIIKVKRASITATALSDYSRACNSTASAAAPNFSNFSRTETIKLLTTQYGAGCGYTVSFLSDDTLRICGTGSYKIIRKYRVTSTCMEADPLFVNMMRDFQHVLTVTGIAPTLSATWTDWGQKNSSVTICGTAKDLKASTTTAQPASSGPITVYSRATATMCNATNVDIAFTASSVTTCSGIKGVTASDNRLTVTYDAVAKTGTVKGLVMSAGGDIVFDIVVADSCSNFGKLNVTVKIVDVTAPAAVCDDVEVTVNGATTAVVRAANINRGSSDNCGIKDIYIRKAGTTSFCNTVEYTCDNAGVNEVDVLYVDFNDNFITCRTTVLVRPVGTVMCTSPANVTINCTETPSFGTPVVMWDGCGAAPTPVVTTTPNTTACGASVAGGTTRTWVYTAGTSVSTCSQTITTEARRGYRLPKVAALDLECAAAADLAAGRPAATAASITSQIFADSTAAQVLRTVVARRDGLTPGDGAATCSSPLIKVEGCVLVAGTCNRYVQKIILWDPCMMSMAYSEVSKGFSRKGTITVPTGTAGTLTDLTYTQDENGRIEIFRFITITPKLDVPVLTITAGANCTFSGAGPLTSCAANPVANFNWAVRVGSATGAIVASGTTTPVSAPGLVAGTSYVLVVNGVDACGVSAAQVVSAAVTAVDNASPTINVHNKTVAIGGTINTPSSAYARLTVTEILNSAGDNCTPINQLKFSIEKGGATTNLLPAVEVGSINFDCTDWTNATVIPATATTPASRYVQVRVWVGDQAIPTNWNYALATITLQNTDLVCAGTQFSVFGAAATENGSPVKDVAVSANYNGVTMGSATSSATGAFNVANLTAGANYQVRAAKTIDTDKKNGVTTLDIALISKHNLGIEALGTAYKVIAADVNKDGEVDGTDMLHIRRFILSITPSLPAGSAWRFIDKSYAFRNAANPFGEDFPEVVNLSNVPAGTTAANFTAVKLGDVNNSFDATQVRGSKALTFNANDMDVVAGNEYTVAINAANFNAAAFQGTFAFEGATVKAVKAGNLNNTSDANFGMFSKAVTASWNGTSEASAEVVNITFVATKSGKLSEMLTVNSSVTMAEGYDAAGNAMNVTLKFNTGKVAGGEFALYQNTPNPVATSTSIGFNLPKDGQAKLTIYTAEGKVLSVINNNYKAGANQVTVNKADLNASGMLYYRLDTQDNSSTRKMIIIE